MWWRGCSYLSEFLVQSSVHFEINKHPITKNSSKFFRLSHKIWGVQRDYVLAITCVIVVFIDLAFF